MWFVSHPHPPDTVCSTQDTASLGGEPNPPLYQEPTNYATFDYGAGMQTLYLAANTGTKTPTLFPTK